MILVELHRNAAMPAGNLGAAPIQSGMEVRIMVEDHRPKPTGDEPSTVSVPIGMGYGHPPQKKWQILRENGL